MSKDQIARNLRRYAAELALVGAEAAVLGAVRATADDLASPDLFDHEVTEQAIEAHVHAYLVDDGSDAGWALNVAALVARKAVGR